MSLSKKPSFKLGFFFTMSLLCLTGCQSSDHRYQLASEIAQPKFQPILYQTEPFNLLAWEQPDVHPMQKLRIYIEGDGFAWLSRYQPSNNPTPTDPIALRLVVADSASNTLYLARPCQYVALADPPCNTLVWTQHRFHSAVLASYQQVLDQMKVKWEAQELELIGFSGGGVIAALLAAQRSDVRLLVTVAAPLSINTWVSYHHVSPLTGSLNPIDFTTALRKIPQCHFVGKADTITPEVVLEDYQQQLASDQSHILLEDNSHEHGWTKHWQQTLRRCTANFIDSDLIKR